MAENDDQWLWFDEDESELTPLQVEGGSAAGKTAATSAEVVKAITAKYTEADMKRGLWGRFGWMAMAAVLVLGALVYIYEAVTGKSSDDDDSPSTHET